MNLSRPSFRLWLSPETAAAGPEQRSGPRHVYHLQFSRTLKLAVAFALLLTAGLSATPARAEAFILVEADSGKVLRAENATYPWYPASVTKLMTLYTTLQAIKQGRVTFDTLFSVSHTAMAQSPTKMGFAIGTQVTVDNALKMMMVKSANDMAVLLAEGVDGSVENFAEDMTRTAHRLGMTESNFVNPNGLPADEQITSPRDMAILARALIHDFPEYNFYWHIPAIKFGRRVVRNYNTLLGRYPGADGMKTGFICAAGFNLVATATRNGRQLIAVVMGAPSSAARAVKAAELLEGGFVQNPLSWLTPALGSVNELTPISAAPPNLHDEVCGKHRKKPAAEDEDEDAGGENANGDNSGAFSALLSSLRAPTPKGAALLSDAGAVTPVVVYTGPTRTPDEIARLATIEPAAPHHKKKSATQRIAKHTDEKATGGKETEGNASDGKTSDGKASDGKASDGKATDSKSDGKATDGKATDGKASAKKPWTPMSSSALAASPPSELQAKAAADAPKKKAHKAKLAAKPPVKPAPAPAAAQ
ncbi:MAG TPA: D-alanyl-D-alanine carboxypeptidase family protein [Xanthobacteraceae bacterium]|nr:D-alanyl-D-alanine carboxypeptidase family protein [Xanthobacteraceae bacterium]